MDYLFAMLETYAQSLQQEVNERMDALAVEKQRSDSLLYRMLPRFLLLDKRKKFFGRCDKN